MRSTQCMDIRSRKGGRGLARFPKDDLSRGMKPMDYTPRMRQAMDHSLEAGWTRISEGISAWLKTTGQMPIFGWSWQESCLALTLMNAPHNGGGRGDIVAWTADAGVALNWQARLLQARISQVENWKDYGDLQELLARRETATAARESRTSRTLAVDTLRCITVHQIWAWAFFHAGKDVENRSFPTDPGLLGIHCGRNDDIGKFRDAAAFVEDMSEARVTADYHACMQNAGRVIGTVEVVEVKRRPDSAWYMGTEWGWLVAKPRLFAGGGYKARGQLGVWNWQPPHGQVIYEKEEA